MRQFWRDKVTRHNALLLFLVLALATCLVQLFRLQILRHGKYEALAQAQHTVKIPIVARRGRIYDRNGQVLAASVTVHSVYIDPSQLCGPVVWTTGPLAKALGLNAGALERSVAAGVAKGSRFEWVKRLVTAEEDDAVKALALPGVCFCDEQKRVYPNDSMLAQVIGFMGVDQHGLAGIEFAFDSALSGADGLRIESRDGARKSKAIFTAESVYRPANDGNSVVLTIDANIQDFLESAIERCQQQYAPKGVMGVVIDPHTGEVLALAQRPTFDPNDYTHYSSATYRPRAITDPFEPGSMFKPFVFSGALDEHVIQLDQLFNCSTLRVGKRVLHDAHAYGQLTARYGVVKSSNIVMAQIGMLLGIPKTFAYVTAFGFGKRTGIELASEAPGKVQPLPMWSSYTITSVPMGHEVSITALQAASAFTAFANGGVVVKPHLVRGVIAPDGTVLRRTKLSEARGQIITQATANVMLTDVLYKVVKEGTGRLADLEDYAIAGKTGTAQKLVNGVYSHNKYTSSFICTGPVEDPRAVVLIVVDEPTRGASFFGGTAAAPYASQVLKSTLDYMYIDGRRRAKPVDYASADAPTPSDGEDAYAP